MEATTVREPHNHSHAPNHLAVIPTPQRLVGDPARTGRGVTIAFIDSGFYPHPDLTQPINRIVTYEDITQPGAALETTAPPPDWAWHGTQTAVAAAGNGYLSDGLYRGMAPGARVVLVKVGDRGNITEENIARGLEWMIKNKDRYNIRVVSISLGGDEEEVPYRENRVGQMAEEAVRQGLVVVAAAGNAGCAERHQPTPPANAPSVITVGGYDDKNRLDPSGRDLYCSSYGLTRDGLMKPEILAPAMWVAAPILPGTAQYRQAERWSRLAASPDYLLDSLSRLVCAPEYTISRLACDIWQEAGLPPALQRQPPATIRAAVSALLRQNKIVATHYQHVDGTSFAAPIVASVIAQMLEANPRLTPAAVKHILISTADRLRGAPVIRQGYGVLNARRAVEQAVHDDHVLDPVHLQPPRVEGDQLVFYYHDDEAESVALVGDFNGWDPLHTRFTRESGGLWQARIELPPPGHYQYKFLLSGGRWVDDPNNGMKAPNAFGELNSVLHVA